MGSPMLVRPARAEDAAEMARVNVRSWQEAYRGLMPDELLDDPAFAVARRRFWTAVLTEERYRAGRASVAERDGEMIGIALAGPSEDAESAGMTQLFVLYVVEAEYGSGAGAALLDAVTEPQEHVVLWVADPNPRAQAFYRKHGFLPDGAVQMEQGVRVIRMVRRPPESRHASAVEMTIARSIRLATQQDVASLPEIERAADALFEELLGPEPFGGDSATARADRVAAPGFVLVVAESADGPAIGFLHVIEVDGSAHIEQLSVLPEHLRRGHGRALVEAAAAEASARGYDRLTLRTYADVPWNRPFYESCGFAVIAPIDSPSHRALVRVEVELGLLRHGRRVLMARDLSSRVVTGTG